MSAPRKTALMLRHRVLSAFIFEVEAEEAEEAEGAERGGGGRGEDDKKVGCCFPRDFSGALII